MQPPEEELAARSVTSWAEGLDMPSPDDPPAVRGKILRRAAAASAIVAGLGASAYGIDSVLASGSPSAAASSRPASAARSASTSPTPHFHGGFGHGFGEGPPAAAGTVVSVGAKSFTVKTMSGTALTVDVSSKTTYHDFGLASASLASVKVNERVAVFGTTSAGTVTATSVAIGMTGGREGDSGQGGSWNPGDGTPGGNDSSSVL